MKAVSFWLVLSLMMGAAWASPVELIRIGIAEDAVNAANERPLELTIDYLTDELSKSYELTVKRIPPGEVLSEVKRNRFDVILMSSADHRKSLLNGTRDIAVLRAAPESNPNRAEGAAVFVDLLNPHLQSLRDLKGRRAGFVGRFTTTTRLSFDGAVLGATGEPPDRLLGGIEHFESLSEAVGALTDAKVDALVMPACFLEGASGQEEVETARLTLLDAKQDRCLACLHSTVLYPGSTFVAMPSLSPEAYNAVLTLLLRADDRALSGRWAIATNFSEVDRTLRSLNDDAWVSLRHPNWRALWARYWPWAAGLLGLFLLLGCHHLLLGRLVRRRTAELQRALDEQKRLRMETDRTRDRLDKMRRLQTIGQLAGLFAHELRQPLNALTCYAYGIRKAVTDAPDEIQSRILTGINGLDEQIHRANAIVERVRDYVRSQSSRDGAHALSHIVRTAVDHFQSSTLGNLPIDVTVEREDATVIRCDAMEMELLVVNLLRNAAQAQQGMPKPCIRVKLVGGDIVRLVVNDDGPPLSAQAFENIVSLGESTKPEGLGLGLSIVRDLTEAHHGRLTFSLTPSNSLQVEVALPSIHSAQIL